MKKLILFFGSFNPIHNGHLAIAKEAIKKLDITHVLFVISPQSPFKVNSPILEFDKRVHLLELGLKTDKELSHRASISLIEKTLPRPNYTFNSLVEIKKNYPEKELLLLIGDDLLAYLRHWYRQKWIVENFSFIIYPRISKEKTLKESKEIKLNIDQQLNAISKKRKQYYCLNKSHLLDISSTSIRDLIKRLYDLNSQKKNNQLLREIDDLTILLKSKLPLNIYNAILDNRFYS